MLRAYTVAETARALHMTTEDVHEAIARGLLWAFHHRQGDKGARRPSSSACRQTSPAASVSKSQVNVTLPKPGGGDRKSKVRARGRLSGKRREAERQASQPQCRVARHRRHRGVELGRGHGWTEHNWRHRAPPASPHLPAGDAVPSRTRSGERGVQRAALA